jgi:hypothetical protein
MVAGTVAITVAILNGGDGATSRQADTSASAQAVEQQFVYILKVRAVPKPPTKAVVTLTGKYEAPEAGWTVYALGKKEEPGEEEAAAKTPWKVQPATIDGRKKTWVAKFTVNTPVTMTWSAVLVYEPTNSDIGISNAPHSCEPTQVSCPTPSLRDDLAQRLEDLGPDPDSDLIQAAAPPKTTTISPTP